MLPCFLARQDGVRLVGGPRAMSEDAGRGAGRDPFCGAPLVEDFRQQRQRCVLCGTIRHGRREV
jgi:hypothetical protein